MSNVKSELEGKDGLFVMFGIQIDEKLNPIVKKVTVPAVSDRFLSSTDVQKDARTFSIQTFECWMTSQEYAASLPVNKPILRAAVFETTAGKPVNVFRICYDITYLPAVYYSYDLYSTNQQHKTLKIETNPVRADAALQTITSFAHTQIDLLCK
jgi:hypothetical protein